MENTPVVSPAEFGLEEKKANELTSGLSTILAEREVLVNAYNDVIEMEITPDNLETFKDLRIKIRDNRTKGILVWHKTNKEVYLRAGQFIDAVKNREIAENERMEEKLAAAEKHFENLEKERLKAIHNKRVELLTPFGYEIGNTDFSSMDENMFNAILTGAKTNHEAKLEAERKAEEERQEALRIEAEEKEKQRVEMERLRKENEEKERELAEQKKAAEEAIRIANEKAEAERKEAARIAKIEADKQAAIIAEQKAKADKLAAELKDKADAEAKAEAERIAAEKKAAKAPDKQKLKTMIDALQLPKLDLKATDAKSLNNLIEQKFEGFKKWANDQIEML